LLSEAEGRLAFYPGSFAGVSLGRLGAFHGARMVDARAVIVPTDEGVRRCSARRQVFGDRPPSAADARDIDPGVDHHLPYDPRPLVAAILGRWDRRCAARPLVIGQVTGVRGLPRPVRPRFFVVPTAAFSASRCPFESPEVQMIHQARTDTQTKSARDAFVNGLITSLW